MVLFLKHLLGAMCVGAKSLYLCPTLCDAVNHSPPGSSVRGILQSRILECVAMPSSRRSSQPEIKLESLVSPASSSGFFTTVPSGMEKAMAPHSGTLAWEIPWMEEPRRLQSMGSLSRTRLSDFTLTFHFHALEKEMATHSRVLAWRIPGTEEPGGLPSVGSHRVRHD